MDGYGLFPTGFIRPRLPEIRDDIAARLQAATGLAFDLSPDSLSGQFITVFADREAAMWEEMERVYLAMYPLTAQGAALDNAVAFAGVLRRPGESDASLRARYAIGVHRLGGSANQALRAGVEEVAGVARVRVASNDTTLPDSESRPPHSVEVTVTGGTDAAVALAIWQRKGQGAVTTGNTAVTITDENGVAQVVRFTRPVPRPVWVRVTLTRYTEEPLSPGITARATDAIAAYGATLQPGEDVLAQRIVSAVMAATQGLRSVAVELSFGTTSAPDGYGAADLAVGVREIAAMEAARIQVIGP